MDAQEISLRDVWEILKRNSRILVLLPLLALGIALMYSFFFATPLFASTAAISVSPLQVQSQLEQKIQVQQSNILSFEGFRAIALSEEVLGEVWSDLKRQNRLPTLWQDRGGRPGTERMVKFLNLKDRTPKQSISLPQGQIPPLTVELNVRAPSPEIAAQAANLWAKATIRRVNELPLGRLRASLAALDEQIAPAEKAYREAQARWELFSRTTNLPQDKAELEAKTQERVNLDIELAGLERDLAAVSGRIAATQREVEQQARIVPVNTSPDQMAILNQRLEAAKARLKAETEKARKAYGQAASALEAFQRKERIPQWNAELAAYTEAYASTQNRILSLVKEIATQNSLLAEAEARLAEYKAQTPGINLENLIAGMKLSEAKALLEGRLKEADTRYKRAEMAYQAFQQQNELGVLKAKLADLTARIGSVAVRLSSIATDRASKSARLQSIEVALGQEPKLLTLEREIAADPVALATAVQGGSLQALVGLKLKNQELNPTHQNLLAQALTLQADLASLAKEEEASRQEQAALQEKVDGFRKQIAALELQQARILSELDVARGNYDAIYRYNQNVLTLAGQDVEDQTLREVNPDVLTFRNKVVEIKAQIAGLEAERAALERNLKTYDERIAALKARTAAQEREKEQITLGFGSKKAIYEVLRNRFDQIAQLSTSELTFDNPNPEYQRLRSALIDAQAEEARLLARKSALLGRIAQVEARIGTLKARLAQAQVESDQVNQALELAKNAYLALVQKKTDLQIELASSQNSLAQLIAPAYPIFEKVAPKRLTIALLAVVFGVLLAVGWMFLSEAVRERPRLTGSET
ncbi:MAG: lipopolysaccharide biosynthesis protein [Meiothermus sp.]